MVNESVMMGGLRLPRVKVFSHFNTLALFLHSHEINGIVQACFGVIPIGIR